jgi:hypothetical protein
MFGFDRRIGKSGIRGHRQAFTKRLRQVEKIKGIFISNQKSDKLLCPLLFYFSDNVRHSSFILKVKAAEIVSTGAFH